MSFRFGDAGGFDMEVLELDSSGRAVALRSFWRPGTAGRRRTTSRSAIGTDLGDKALGDAEHSSGDLWVRHGELACQDQLVSFIEATTRTSSSVCGPGSRFVKVRASSP